MARWIALKKVVWALSFFFSSGAFAGASADLELRFYSGPAETDLREKIVVKASGEVADYLYNKICVTRAQCRSERANSDEEARQSPIPLKEMDPVNAAVAVLPDGLPTLKVSPTKPGLCEFYRRFQYVVVKSGQDPIVIDSVENCMGNRIADPKAPKSPHPSADLIESALNRAAEIIGF